jgi:outer membrane protein
VRRLFGTVAQAALATPFFGSRCPSPSRAPRYDMKKIPNSRLQSFGVDSPRATRALVTALWVGAASLTGVMAITTAPSAHANPQLFAEAKKLIGEMRASQAYMLLIAEQDKLAGNAEYDYLLGVAALDSGKVDDAIIAFERVLALQPRNAGATLDLGRAYFNAGALDLAETTFTRLRAMNPPTSARMAIDRYLAAIADRRKSQRRALSVWGETSLGYDSNLTGVPSDFTSAVQQSFNLVGVLPTGNSIKRKAPYVAGALGGDVIMPLSEQWSAYVGADVRGRAYRKEAAFNSVAGDARASLIWSGAANQVRFNASFNRFAQDGDAPGDPQPTNDRRTALGGAEWRYNLSQFNQFSVGAMAGQTRFLKNEVEDYDSVIGVLGWSTSSLAKGAPQFQLTAFYSRDEAQRKLADGVADKSKKVLGVRAYGQYNLRDTVVLFGNLGFSQRRDDSAFARATTIEFGRDRLADLTLGVNWKFQERCGLRAQAATSRNTSNIAIYEYTRVEVSSNIRCEFF